MTQPLSALSEDEAQAVARCTNLHDQELPELENLDRWYENTQRVKYLQESMFPEATENISEVRVALPQVAVDSIAERLFLQGIHTGDEDLDEEVRRIWLANHMDLGLSQAIVDALTMRRSYISVGTNEDDESTPLVMPESPLELFVRYDPRTRKGIEGLRRWCVYDAAGTLTDEYQTLYMPNSTIWMERGRDGGWRVEDRDDHNLGELPIASLINRPRTAWTMNGEKSSRRERVGRSDLTPVIPLAASMNKLATDMMVAAERVAIPLRAIFGAGPDQFKDQAGNQLTPMQALKGGLLAIPETDVTAYQFAAAQLENFTGAMREIANQVTAVTGLPPHYTGSSADNPASAEGIISAESRLITRAEGKQLSFGVGVLQACRLMIRFATGDWDKAMDTATLDWRDVRTPTVGARADAAMKLGPKDRPILPMRNVRQELGYSDDQIADMEEQDELDAQKSAQGRLAGAITDQRVNFNDGAGQQPAA